jgi:hypothetical protein
LRKIPKTFNVELDLLIYIEKKGKEIGVRKESTALNQLIREFKEREEKNQVPKEQSKISIAVIKKANEQYEQSKEYLKLKEKHPILMRECLNLARERVPLKGGFEKKHKKFVDYLKNRDALALKLLKLKLKKDAQEVKDIVKYSSSVHILKVKRKKQEAAK